MRLKEIIDSFKTINPEKFIKLYCGEELNRGTTRKVYVLKDNPKYVVKIQYGICRFDNIIENEIYREVWSEDKYKEILKYLAPCIWISKNGKILIQRRIKHKKKKSSYPIEIPSFFNDCKLTNYGWIGKQFVCCDYANFTLIKGLKTKLKKADWWVLAPNKYKMK